MGREVHVVVLILLSIFEVWMCYQVLYRTVLDKKYLRTWQKVLIWVNILGVGTLLGINRSIFFFSNVMLFFGGIITILVAVSFGNSKWYLLGEIIGIYYFVVALLDFFFAFLGMTVIDHFYHVFNDYDVSNEKIVLYALTRLGVLIIGFFFKNHKIEELVLKKAEPFLIITVGSIIIIVTIYHYLIYDIIHGLSTVTGWSAACSLLAIFIIILFCIAICWKNQNLKQENQILEIREKLELEKLKDMNRALEQNRIQVHDMRHHLIILKEYVKRKDYFEVGKYLDQLLESYTEIQEEKWTRIRHLDILLNEKKREAKRAGIEFNIETDVLKSLPFKETEISVLFGNLLDNAIEACSKIEEGQKSIWVEIRQKKEILFITIENTIGLIPKEKNGKIVSDKRDKKIHGYGLMSIKRIVKRYDGEIRNEITDKKFNIYISFFNEFNELKEKKNERK